MKNILKNKIAQSIIEFALIFAAIAAAAAGMGIYVRRSANAKLERTAIGLNAVFRDMNAPGASGSGGRDFPFVPEPPPPAAVSTEELSRLRDLLNNGDFATGLDLLSQAQSALQHALIGGDITEGTYLLNQALALFNGMDFSWLRAVSGEMDASIPGISEIRAGISEFDRGIAAANETLSLLSQPDAAIIIMPGVPFLYLSDALNSLNNAISALYNARDLFNRGIDLMEASAQ
jgi:hypothetical protein